MTEKLPGPRNHKSMHELIAQETSKPQKMDSTIET
jgi:hypothetical protein